MSRLLGVAGVLCGQLVHAASYARSDYEPIEILYDQTGAEGGTFAWWGWLAMGVILILVAALFHQRRRNQRLGREWKQALEQTNDRLKEAQLVARIGSWTRDFDTGETFWSEEACNVLGLTGTEDNDKHYERLIHPDDVDKVTEVVATAYHQGGSYQCDHRIICKDKSEKYIRLVGKVYMGDDQSPVRETGTVQDITQQHLTEVAVQRSEQRLRSILDATPQPILIVERSEFYPVLYANRSAFRLFDLEPDFHVEEMRLALFWNEPAQMAELFNQAEEKAVSGQQMMLKTVSGKHFWSEISCSVMDFTGLDSLFLSVSDITERRQMLADLERLATTDPLTGILNRRSYFEAMQRELRRSVRYRHPFSVLIADIDHFKRVNDKYGHSFGDEVLHRFCEVTQSCLREEDLFGRIGGEEFGVVLVSSGRDGGYVVAERIRRRWQDESFEFQGSRCNFTVSIGVAQLQSDKEAVEDVMERADRGLYEAKRAGRNCVIVFSGDSGQEAQPGR